MNEIQTIVVGLLNTPPFDKRFAQIRRVFAVQGIAPTCDTCGGVELSPRYWLFMIKQSIITHYRTEEAKAYRKIHGDRGGCRYQDKYHRPSPFPWSNCISTVTKDNLLCQEYF